VNSPAIFTAVFAVALALLSNAAASGQSLAELARKEQERRKAIKTPSKVYSNHTLNDADAPPVSVVGASEPGSTEGTARPDAAQTPSRPPAAPAGRAPEADKGGDEKFWRKRISDARAELARQELFAEALQSRINALTTDFVARDDPAQRGVLAGDRQKTAAEMGRVRAEIQRLTTTIAEIEEEARRAGVPPGWLR
jgi:hypothetical protein